jgi:hypothetical protein
VPIALPLWFVVLDRRIYVSGPLAPNGSRASGTTRACRSSSSLASDGRSLCRPRDRSGTGRDGVRGARRVADALDTKYRAFRSPRATMPAATRRHYEVKLATIEITPDERILSWDNARLARP